MNKFIKEQLSKVKYATLPYYTDDTKTIVIQRQNILKDLNNNLKINGEYTIEVEDYILHPYDGFTLHANWNDNKIPTEKVMHVKLLEIVGKMYHVESNNWCGWLPRKSFKVINK